MPSHCPGGANRMISAATVGTATNAKFKAGNGSGNPETESGVAPLVHADLRRLPFPGTAVN
jgi:hypothetical protein